MIIKKIFSKKFDDEIHSDFLKFGRGEFKDRYLIDVKKQSSGWSIKTSSEFTNFFVKKCFTAAPAYVPTNFYEQIVFAHIGADYLLYIYLDGVWKSVALT